MAMLRAVVVRGRVVSSLVHLSPPPPFPVAPSRLSGFDVRGGFGSSIGVLRNIKTECSSAPVGVSSSALSSSAPGGINSSIPSSVQNNEEWVLLILEVLKTICFLVGAAYFVRELQVYWSVGHKGNYETVKSDNEMKQKQEFATRHQVNSKEMISLAVVTIVSFIVGYIFGGRE